jgi:hypothetical protein
MIIPYDKYFTYLTLTYHNQLIIHHFTLITVFRPRKGRVETEIKQPREAELQTHEEKTWRHIRAIQAKMTG